MPSAAAFSFILATKRSTPPLQWSAMHSAASFPDGSSNP